MNEQVLTAINEQINHELASAYAYLSACAYFEATNYPGFARWMRAQSREEVAHAMKFFDFVHDRGGRATLAAIGQPPADFASPLAVFQRALEHERKVTALIHNLYALAVRERDYPAQVLLQWFITEQVEEEKSASAMVEALTRAGEDARALLLLDDRAGARADGDD